MASSVKPSSQSKLGLSRDEGSAGKMGSPAGKAGEVSLTGSACQLKQSVSRVS
jgi:hypothetical protein